MGKIKLEDLITVLNSDVCRRNTCIEMHFSMDDDKEYENCWIGKMRDDINPEKEVYWYGLTPDGSQAYDYDKLENILNAQVFHGKSLRDLIEKITWDSLDACSIEEMLPLYLNDAN